MNVRMFHTVWSIHTYLEMQSLRFVDSAVVNFNILSLHVDYCLLGCSAVYYGIIFKTVEML
jgi:hypothetical protein